MERLESVPGSEMRADSAFEVRVKASDYIWKFNPQGFGRYQDNLRKEAPRLKKLVWTTNEYGIFSLLTASQREVVCKQVAIATDEKIDFRFMDDERGSLPYIDYTSFEVVENGQQPARTIVLSPLVQASFSRSRFLTGRYQKAFGRALKVDLFWTITDAVEISDPSTLNVPSEAFPNLYPMDCMTQIVNPNKSCSYSWPTQLNYDTPEWDKWDSPILKILK